jgi:hypothetical protein
MRGPAWSHLEVTAGGVPNGREFVALRLWELGQQPLLFKRGLAQGFDKELEMQKDFPEVRRSESRTNIG